MQVTFMNCQPQCLASSQTFHPMSDRRSVNYQPSSWSHDLLESLKTDQTEICKERSKKLEEELRNMIDDEDVEPLVLLELADNIQRLGLGYRFEKNIKKALRRIMPFEGSNEREDWSLHVTALSFMLLRQHGYEVSQDVFKRFKDHNGNFKACLCNDVKGMLSLYGASYLAFEGESILDEAKAFTSIHLKDHIGKIDPRLAEQINHALELPLHRRMTRLESREYIDAYSTREDANQELLQLAVVDFNTVQSALQKELGEMSRWWRELGLANKLSFIRDRITESFFCSVGLVSEPQFSNCRKGLTKVFILITSIDDVYDIYGSLEELELFTEAVERWSLDAVEKLPDSLKLSFQALYNTVNQMASENLKEQGVNTISNLKKTWADLCKTLLLEAKWQYEKYRPTFKDCLDNAWRSSGGVVILVHAYCLISENIKKEGLDCLDKHYDLLSHPSMILRLCNDLASSSADLKEDNAAKLIPCYIHETGLSVEFAHEHLKNLIDETWKKMNKHQAADPAPFPGPFMETILNFARTCHVTYQYGDAYGAPDNISKKRVSKLLIEPAHHEKTQKEFKLRL